MKRFLQSLWFKILAGILAILVVFTIIAGVSSSRGNPLSSTIGLVAQPFEVVASGVSHGAHFVKNLFTRSSTYEARIDDLQNQLTEYQQELADYENTKQQLAQYEAFLGIQETHKDFEVVSASIIGKDSADNYTTFVLSKGSLSGVKVNDPVIYGSGQLIGVVTKVAPTYCIVSTILNPSISISVYDVRTREAGYVTNTADLAAKGYCKLSGLKRDTTVSKGGVINTAGVGGIYPRDLVIGTVTEVQNDEYNLSAYAVVKPNFAISDVQEVLIMTAFEGQGMSAATDKEAKEGNAASPEVVASTEKAKEDTTAAIAETVPEE